MVLTIQRPGEKKPRKFEITRKQITTPQVTYYGVKNDSIGYIYLKAFTIKSAQEVKEAFLDLKKNHNIKSLVLDLRGNGGGVLEGTERQRGAFNERKDQAMGSYVPNLYGAFGYGNAVGYIDQWRYGFRR